MDRSPAGARVRTKHGPDLLLVPESGLNMDRPSAGVRVRTKHVPDLLLVSESGLNMDRSLLVPEAMDCDPLVIPELSEEESYHVFCSYSSTDSQWTQDLIQQLEDSGLKVCGHEDFMVGHSILDIMSESIHQSQKVLLVLSAEFVRSRWCLLEANMSMFKTRDLPIPLHLAHLTYLDVQLPDFRQQLLRVLCKPNQEMQGCTVVPYQPPYLYDGKTLEPLSPVNEEQLNQFDCGEWSNTVVPQQLHLIVQQPERYSEAIGIINTVSKKKVKYKTFCSQCMYNGGLIAIIFVCGSAMTALFTQLDTTLTPAIEYSSYACLVAVGLYVMYKIVAFRKHEPQRILRELQKAVGQANSLLFEEHILLGAKTNSKLLLVYVSVEGCRQELCDSFQTAILQYSCGYAWSLAKRYFPFPTSSTSSHLKGGVCFCQYVTHQRSLNKSWFSCCRKTDIKSSFRSHLRV
ncbi:hypothetical protein WMY93_011723 [Mugilogobius chulae]|uniref:TIR domain-containing protein n=1 Tax=Mugilogobius chulae TaxID=88201 RepID=A0AAW0P6W2_9GOBI